jgi:hypothetical protein
MTKEQRKTIMLVSCALGGCSNCILRKTFERPCTRIASEGPTDYPASLWVVAAKKILDRGCLVAVNEETIRMIKKSIQIKIR